MKRDLERSKFSPLPAVRGLGVMALVGVRGCGVTWQVMT